MKNSETLRLCGGIFLTLILNALHQRSRHRSARNDERDGLSIPEVLIELVKIINPAYETPKVRFNNTANDYKSCRISTSANLPFGDKYVMRNFDNRIKSHYDAPLSAMELFVKRALDTDPVNNKHILLVKQLIDLVQRDDSIGVNEEFYIGRKGEKIKKADFNSLSDIYLPSFLLGIWHYAVTKKPDNTIGAATYFVLCPPTETSKGIRKYDGTLGESLKLPINVQLPENEARFYEARAKENSICKPADNKDEIKQLREKYSDYLENVYEKYSLIKTLLYRDAPKKFYDFYVCNSLSRIIPKEDARYYDCIRNASINDLLKRSNFTLITGTGGLGKSMMIRHLLLNAIDYFDSFGKVPILIPLKDYSTSYSTLLDCVFAEFKRFALSNDIDDLSNLLSQGSCFLLFDGLDEIKSENKAQFEHDLDVFTDQYKKNVFVVSTRPRDVIPLSKFTKFDLDPFCLAQAEELINKLDFRPDEPIIKKKFLEELRKSLFHTHAKFAQNPLLLTIMLMTYEHFAEVPSKMHIFYKEVYSTLSQKHDASKGGYRREFKSGLTADQLEKFFAEFCARSYCDENFDFDDNQFENYFNKLKIRSESPGITASAFKDDLIESLCIMYEESGRYHFIHRSFQEYFAALFFSKQKDKTLGRIGEIFSKLNDQRRADNTFYMLYDMIPEKIEEYIFEPYLLSLFNPDDSEEKIEFSYWGFIKNLYHYIRCSNGYGSNPVTNSSKSFIYDSIIRIKHLGPRATVLTLKNRLIAEEVEEFVVEERGYVDEDFDPENFPPDVLFNIATLPPEYIKIYGKPEPVYKEFDLDMEFIFGEYEFFEELLEALADNNFSIKQEYYAVRKYLQELIAKHNPPPSDDLFDIFQ